MPNRREFFKTVEGAAAGQAVADRAPATPGLPCLQTPSAGRRQVFIGTRRVRVVDIHGNGTDVPFNWPVTVDLVLNAPFLTDTGKEAILGGNAARLLHIEA